MSAPPDSSARPVSPHLQVWRWHVTMATSIFHRATGVALYAGAVGLAAWLAAAAFAPDLFVQAQALLIGPLGQVALYGLAVSLCYHLANGVRHLVWDMGRGLDVKSADASGWFVLAFGFLAPLGFWLLAAAKGG